MMEQNTGKPTVVIVSSPGMGHLIPLTQFSTLLASHFNLSISLLLPGSTRPDPAQISFLNSLPSSISHTFLLPIDPTHLPTTTSHSLTITHILTHSLPSIRAHLVSLAQHARVVALVTDLFGTGLFTMAWEMGIPPYMYFTTNAMCLSFLMHLPILDKTVSCEYRAMPDPLVLPGCVPLYGKDFDEPTQDRTSNSYKEGLERVKHYRLAKGIFVNSFFDLEPGAFQALQMDDPSRAPVYPIGPIVQSVLTRDDDGFGCLSWLDRQPLRSVLYVCFGSGGTITSKQIRELALGLEKTGLRFLWIVKSPNDQTSSGSFFKDHSKYVDLDFLPEGYQERVKDRGLLVPCWAPQMKVLSHESIGGFLTHCGWNSILESIVCGVPLILWPLYAEQRMNAVMLENGLKVGLRPKENKHGVVESEEVVKVVKELMEGQNGNSDRHRMKELSGLGKKATSENGDSTKLLSSIVSKWLGS